MNVSKNEYGFRVSVELMVMTVELAEKISLLQWLNDVKISVWNNKMSMEMISKCLVGNGVQLWTRRW